LLVQEWHRRASRETFARLGGRLEDILDGERFGAFAARIERHGPRLIAGLHALYGWTYDFYWHLERILLAAAEAVADRPADLVALDTAREAAPDWFRDNGAVGGVLYVDRFAGTLDGVRRKIPYFRSLGLTYLHLMPLFAVPQPENDGGYAVSDYRTVDPRLGSMEDLAALSRDLREAGISLVVDFILNHTSDQHAWAEAAKAGDPEKQDFYWMFDDRRTPDRFQPYLRAIFPDRGGDSFTWRPDVPGPHGGKWVWTTFYTFQWDLNYRNPALLAAIAGEMLFLANQGVEVLRLDAVPFLWKEPGTNCENRPEAHTVVQVLNAIAAIAAPALAFKSEAIVHPDEVVRFVSPEECRLSYNPLVMALMWEALATGEVRMLRDALARRQALPGGTAWINYLRCHDDIGWGFADEDATRLGIDPRAHRDFLNAFYTGRFPGSFAAGLPFQENPETGDCRICGTLASLAGLEAAETSGEERAVDLAVRRILMLHGLIMTLPGVPLLYLGDELAQPNDYGYRDDPGHAADARWVHRPVFPWARTDAPADTPAGRVRDGLAALIALRKATPAFAAGDLSVVDLDNPHVVAFRRGEGREVRVVMASFSATPQMVGDAPVFAALEASVVPNALGGGARRPSGRMVLEPYAFLCLEPG
jgi:amylosucrase